LKNKDAAFFALSSFANIGEDQPSVIDDLLPNLLGMADSSTRDFFLQSQLLIGANLKNVII
jgi:hypothetical protein